MRERKEHLDGLAIALLVACCLFWGFQQILIKTTVGEVPPLWQAALRFAGATVLLQGISEVVRCIVCLKTGQWTERLEDAEEIDVVEQQLSSSTHVDDQARRDAIAKAKSIDEAARQRMGQE